MPDLDFTCIICLNTFGVQENRSPHSCHNTKCGQNYCSECLDAMRNCNQSGRPFRCMFCLEEYAAGEYPKRNNKIVEQLWKTARMKYGFESHNGDISNEALLDDISFEMENRHFHLEHLLITLEQIPNWNDTRSACLGSFTARGVLSRLSEIRENIKKSNENGQRALLTEYMKVITLPGDSFGTFYIRISEHLNWEIADAEHRSLFPAMYRQQMKWISTENTSDAFQPNVSALFAEFKKDVDALISDHSSITARAKIGFIGYTSSGKTTLICRILGIDPKSKEAFLPIRSTRSTHYPLEFVREQPLTKPDKGQPATPVKLIDIQGWDHGCGISNHSVQPGNYLDEIRKADCDIYVLVFENDLDVEQMLWVNFIEKQLQRQCILVRSKVDIPFSRMFLERTRLRYEKSSEEERRLQATKILDTLRRSSQKDNRRVYLVAADYFPDSENAALLLRSESLDLQALISELGRVAPLMRRPRFLNRTARAVAKTINICFRRAYLLRVLNCQMTAGIASVISLEDCLPPYLARDQIESNFGINQDFLGKFRQYDFTLREGKLQTNVLNNLGRVIQKDDSPNSTPSTGNSGILFAMIAAVGFSNEATQGTRTANLTGSRALAKTAVHNAGVLLSSGIGIWSTKNTEKHVFIHVNEVCDDLILLSTRLSELFLRQLS